MKRCKCGCGRFVKLNRIFFSRNHYANWMKNKTLEEIYGSKKSKRVKYKTYEKIYGKQNAKKLIKLRSKKNSRFYKHGKGYRGYDGFTGSKKRKIKRMFNGICVVCNKKINKKYNGSCHHINYNKKDSRLINLIYLHSNRSKFKCHKKIDKNKDYWFAYFCYLKNIEPKEVIMYASDV